MNILKETLPKNSKCNAERASYSEARAIKLLPKEKFKSRRHVNQTLAEKLSLGARANRFRNFSLKFFS